MKFLDIAMLGYHDFELKRLFNFVKLYNVEYLLMS